MNDIQNIEELRKIRWLRRVFNAVKNGDLDGRDDKIVILGDSGYSLMSNKEAWDLAREICWNRFSDKELRNLGSLTTHALLWCINHFLGLDKLNEYFSREMKYMKKIHDLTPCWHADTRGARRRLKAAYKKVREAIR